MPFVAVAETRGLQDAAVLARLPWCSHQCSGPDFHYHCGSGCVLICYLGVITVGGIAGRDDTHASVRTPALVACLEVPGQQVRDAARHPSDNLYPFHFNIVFNLFVFIGVIDACLGVG